MEETKKYIFFEKESEDFRIYFSENHIDENGKQ